MSRGWKRAGLAVAALALAFVLGAVVRHVYVDYRPRDGAV